MTISYTSKLVLSTCFSVFLFKKSFLYLSLSVII
nr:MAG TPA: hypothetical protein [Caudoviricetes sp.]